MQNKFEEYGKILDIKLPLSRKSGQVRGYALIEFSEFRDAQAAVKEENGSEMHGMTLKVDMAFRSKPLEKE